MLYCVYYMLNRTIQLNNHMLENWSCKVNTMNYANAKRNKMEVDNLGSTVCHKIKTLS